MKFEIVHDKSHLFIYFLLFAKDMAHLRTILEFTATVSGSYRAETKLYLLKLFLIDQH